MLLILFIISIMDKQWALPLQVGKLYNFSLYNGLRNIDFDLLVKEDYKNRYMVEVEGKIIALEKDYDLIKALNDGTIEEIDKDLSESLEGFDETGIMDIINELNENKEKNEN